MAINRASSGRTDEQLLEVLDEPSEWIVRGRGGRIIETAGCLRAAVVGAAPLGHDVTALVRLSGDTIIVFVAQIGRLVGLIGRN